MSSNTSDLSKQTVEDIFRAKMERRQRLASLPFEKKIEIVNKLRTAVAGIQREKFIFESFLNVCPEFAGEPIKEWDVVEKWYANRALAPPPKPFDKLTMRNDGEQAQVHWKLVEACLQRRFSPFSSCPRAGPAEPFRAR